MDVAGYEEYLQEVEGKSVDINVKIENPSPNSSTTVDVVLTSGDSKDIGDFSSKTLTFPC